MSATQSLNATAAAIRVLAERHGVAYTRTDRDVLAGHITRLAGDKSNSKPGGGSAIGAAISE